MSDLFYEESCKFSKSIRHMIWPTNLLHLAAKSYQSNALLLVKTTWKEFLLIVKNKLIRYLFYRCRFIFSSVGAQFLGARAL